MVLVVKLINSTVLMEYTSISMKLFMLLIDIITEFNGGYAVRFLFFLLLFRKWENDYVGATVGVTIAGQSGIPGSWSYQLSNPTHIKFDLRGNMYVMDTSNKRIQRWNPGSTYGITTVSTTALLNGMGIAFDLAGNLIVVDYSSHRVVKFPITCCKLLLPIRNYFIFFQKKKLRSIFTFFFLLATPSTTIATPARMSLYILVTISVMTHLSSL